MDNYQISRDRAQAYFLSFDQEQIIRDWGINWDEQQLFVTFLGKDYAICRQTGVVTRLWSGEQASHGEVLSIFDLLCHQGGRKFPAGTYAPVNSLPGAPRTGGVGTDFHSQAAARFDRGPEAFQKACQALGGIRVAMGDIGYRFEIFGGLSMVLKFYHADEDFSASVTLLWDDNTLQFIFYETVFYIAGCLTNGILREMDKKEHQSFQL